MRVAALDIGTNTVLCLIADIQDGKIQKVRWDESQIVRLGEGVHHNRVFSEAALLRAELCFKHYSKIIEVHKAKRVLAVATSAARDVKNSDRLLDLGRRYNIPIQIISGTKEAELTFRGMASGVQITPNTFGLDIGGGSTEVVGRNSSGDIDGISVDVGCVRLHELFVKSDPISETELQKMQEFANQHLQRFSSIRPEPLIAVAGTPTTFAAIDLKTEFDAQKIDGYRLKVSRVREMTRELASLPVERRKNITGLDAGRADVIVVGGVILETAARLMRVPEVVVSVRGIRYGLALDLGKEE